MFLFQQRPATSTTPDCDNKVRKEVSHDPKTNKRTKHGGRVRREHQPHSHSEYCPLPSTQDKGFRSDRLCWPQLPNTSRFEEAQVCSKRATRILHCGTGILILAQLRPYRAAAHSHAPRPTNSTTVKCDRRRDRHDPSTPNPWQNHPRRPQARVPASRMLWLGTSRSMSSSNMSFRSSRPPARNWRQSSRRISTRQTNGSAHCNRRPKPRAMRLRNGR